MELKRQTKTVVGIVGVLGVLAVTAGSCDDKAANHAESNNVASQQDTYNRAQPIHQYPFSVYRDTLQYVEDAEANGYASNSFMLNKTGTLNHSCPSIGLPVHVTDQLSNPWMPDWGTNAAVAVGQMENTGVYSGQSSGTYVLCVRPNGSRYADYWEGDVEAVTAPAHWDDNINRMIVDGDAPVQPTVRH